MLSAAQREGLSVAMVTLTQRHKKSQSLADLWAALAPALHAALGAGARDVRKLRKELGVVGVVRRIEATHGRSGWHLHPHVLVFAEGATDDDFQQFGEEMFKTWKAKLVEAGMRAPTKMHGFNVKVLDLRCAEREAARYVTSAGSFHAAAELADRGGKSARYGNRTTWELLADAQAGDEKAAALWTEWEKASKGRRALTWSGVRNLAAEHHEEVEEARREPAVVGRLTPAEWSALCRHELGPGALLRAVTVAYLAARHRGCEDAEALADAAGDLHFLLALWEIRPEP